MKGEWHINDQGEVKKCKAEIKCEFGDTFGGHAKTKEEAKKLLEAHYEKLDQIRSLVKDPKTPDAELQKWAKKYGEEYSTLRFAPDACGIICHISENPTASEETLRIVAKHGCGSVARENVVKHPNATTKLFDEMVDEPKVRFEELVEIAQSSKASPEALRKLAKYDAMTTEYNWPTDFRTQAKGKVRRAVADNVNTPPDVLEDLLNDPDWFVAAGAEKNPKTPMKALLNKAERLATE